MLAQYSHPSGTPVVGVTAYVGFFGTNFGDTLPLNSYQNSTIITNQLGTVNLGELPNVKFISSTQGNIGGSNIDLSQVGFNNCTLLIRLHSGSAVRLQAVKLYAHSGSNIAVGPSNMSVRGFEKGANSWTTMSGSAAPLVLTPHMSSGSNTHDYYVGLSATPTASGSNMVNLTLYAEWY